MEVQSMSIEYANVTYRTVRYLPVPDTNIYVRTYKYEDNIFSHLRRIDTYDTYVDCESVIHRFPFNSFIRFFDWSTKSSSYGTVWYRNRYCTVLYCTVLYCTVLYFMVPVPYHLLNLCTDSYLLCFVRLWFSFVHFRNLHYNFLTYWSNVQVEYHSAYIFKC